MWWKACVQWFRKHSKKQKILIAAVIAIAFTLFFPIVSSISGRRFGSSVGVAVGSFHAITEDMPAAYHQGIEDGLSAEDVRTDIGVRLREIGKLNVLAANAELSDIHKVGDTYAAIYTLGADVVFSVDLTEAEVFTNSGEKELIIRLPRPVAQINIDSTRTRLEDEWSRILFDGKTEHGIEEYINSMKNIQANAEEQLEDYDRLQRRAEESAVKQVTMLTGLIVGNDIEIEIQFDEKAGELK